MEQKRNWGGHRAGSGRPKKEAASRKVHSTFTLEPEVAQAIQERATAEGVTRSEALGRCIREWKRSREK